MTQALNVGLAEFWLNDVNDVISALNSTSEYDAAMPQLQVIARV